MQGGGVFGSPSLCKEGEFLVPPHPEPPPNPLLRKEGENNARCGLGAGDGEVVAAALVAGGENDVDAVDAFRAGGGDADCSLPLEDAGIEEGDAELVGDFVGGSDAGADFIMEEIGIGGGVPFEEDGVDGRCPSAGDEKGVGGAAGRGREGGEGCLEGGGVEAGFDDAAILFHALFGGFEKEVALFAGEGGLLGGVFGGDEGGAKCGEVGGELRDEVASGEGDGEGNAGEGGVGVDGVPEEEEVLDGVEEFAFGGGGARGGGEGVGVAGVGEVAQHPFAELNAAGEKGVAEGDEVAGGGLGDVVCGENGVDGGEDGGAVCGEVGEGVAASEGEGRGSEGGIDGCPMVDKFLHGRRIGADSGEWHGGFLLCRFVFCVGVSDGFCYT